MQRKRSPLLRNPFPSNVAGHQTSCRRASTDCFYSPSSPPQLCIVKPSLQVNLCCTLKGAQLGRGATFDQYENMQSTYVLNATREEATSILSTGFKHDGIMMNVWAVMAIHPLMCISLMLTVLHDSLWSLRYDWSPIKYEMGLPLLWALVFLHLDPVPGFLWPLGLWAAAPPALLIDLLVLTLLIFSDRIIES